MDIATSVAAMREHDISQGPHLLERKTGSLREKTDAAFVDVAVETGGSRNAFGLGAAFNGNGLAGTYTDDVIAE